MSLSKGTINKEELNEIKECIIREAHNPQKTNIIAVTKTFSFTAIESAHKNNIYNVGENKIQEIEKKITNKTIPSKTKIHFIGRLQRNKVKKAVKLCDYIQSVNTIKLLEKINKESKKIQKKQKIYLQINIGKDSTKQGFFKEEVKKLEKNFLKYENIQIKGIMGMLPKNISRKKTMKLYLAIAEIQKKIKKKHIPTCTELSIGMSNDYKLALQAGATQIRIGTKLYGKRK